LATGVHCGYNRVMKARHLHPWDLTTAEARDWQVRLASSVDRRAAKAAPALVAGADIAVRPDGTARAAVVVLTYPAMEFVEKRTIEGVLSFPYVPGLLSYREAPLILAACERVRSSPDLMFIDGQGIAHPRRMGIASHLGLLLDLPTIGCAKSRLCGTHEPPGDEEGHYAELQDGDEVIGVALRTKTGVRPLYVSIGHRIDLHTAMLRVSRSCRGYRVPEPTRLAHLAATAKARD
jgi:deoxyribonuclease V